MNNKTTSYQFCLSYFALPAEDRGLVKVTLDDQSNKDAKKKIKHRRKRFALGSH